MIKILTFRRIFFLSFFITAILLGMAAYLQIDEGLSPCPLCVLQRAQLALLSFIFLLGAIVNCKKKGQLFFSFFAMVISLSGVILSGRHAWLQHYPATEAGGCGVSLTYLLKIMSLKDVIATVWRGGAECSELGWVLGGLSLAEWSLIWFGLFFLLTTMLFFSARANK
jgi:disulfide bond formation protein DsbB